MSTSEILPATCRSNFTKYSRRATEETQQEREEEGVEEDDEEKLVTIKKKRPGDAAGQRRQRERKCQLTWVCLHEGWNAFLNPVSDSQAKQASLKH
ncbi:hypothetical protein TGMAS_412810 [Toxoplasma gondii MAS]|uniref:Uncharacterized protein n=1 Tax=Toxoplasma gondii MAS TaxID=943118 RepID=A0A086QYK9_TOXGO|nr:hypothetical protein TGMAS_412810 [Toxoplasma gondii MAS]